MQLRDGVLLLAAVLSLGLAGCDKGNPAQRNPVTGATGRAGNAGGSSSSSAQAGSGLQGGLGTNSMGAGPAPTASSAGSSIPDGSKNRTTGGSVGNR
jgi:hypothetical protein